MGDVARSESESEEEFDGARGTSVGKGRNRGTKRAGRVTTVAVGAAVTVSAVDKGPGTSSGLAVGGAVDGADDGGGTEAARGGSGSCVEGFGRTAGGCMRSAGGCMRPESGYMRSCETLESSEMGDSARREGEPDSEVRLERSEKLTGVRRSSSRSSRGSLSSPATSVGEASTGRARERVFRGNGTEGVYRDSLKVESGKKEKGGEPSSKSRTLYPAVYV